MSSFTGRAKLCALGAKTVPGGLSLPEIMPEYMAGHILRTVYNCTEREQISDLQTFPNILSFPFHPPKL